MARAVWFYERRYGDAMNYPNDGVTVHAFIRPGTPASAGPAVVTQIVDLYEFGVIGPGSEVWANLDVPNALWVLGDTSTFLRFADVPSAGWVRLTHSSVVWGRVSLDTTRSPSHGYSVADMPMPLQTYDTVTVAFRNTDAARMHAQFGGSHHPMRDYQIEHGPMRAIDLKPGGTVRRPPISEPSQFSRNHAGVRGLDLMACTTGPSMHRIIRENLDAFTVVIDPSDFSRIRVAQQKINDATVRITDPIVQRIASLRDIGPFIGDAEDGEPALAEESGDGHFAPDAA